MNFRYPILARIKVTGAPLTCKHHPARRSQRDLVRHDCGSSNQNMKPFESGAVLPRLLLGLGVDSPHVALLLAPPLICTLCFGRAKGERLAHLASLAQPRRPCRRVALTTLGSLPNRLAPDQLKSGSDFLLRGLRQIL